MSEDFDEFKKRIQLSSLKELKMYEKAAIVASKFIGVIGISVILLLLYFPSIPVIIATGVFVYILANVGVGINNSLDLIREQISKSSGT